MKKVKEKKSSSEEISDLIEKTYKEAIEANGRYGRLHNSLWGSNLRESDKVRIKSERDAAKKEYEVLFGQLKKLVLKSSKHLLIKKSLGGVHVMEFGPKTTAFDAVFNVCTSQGGMSSAPEFKERPKNAGELNNLLKPGGVVSNHIVVRGKKFNGDELLVDLIGDSEPVVGYILWFRGG